jgi:hypothetical protein
LLLVDLFGWCEYADGMAITESPAVADDTAAKIVAATLGAAVLGPPTFDDVAD